MKMDGNYHIVLKSGVSETDFVAHVHRQFSTMSFATRITRAIDSRLLRSEMSGFSPHYTLQVSVDLVTDTPYRFDERVPEIIGLVEAFGVVTGVDIYTVIESSPTSA